MHVPAEDGRHPRSDEGIFQSQSARRVRCGRARRTRWAVRRCAIGTLSAYDCDLRRVEIQKTIAIRGHNIAALPVCSLSPCWLAISLVLGVGVVPGGVEAVYSGKGEKYLLLNSLPSPHKHGMQYCAGCRCGRRMNAHAHLTTIQGVAALFTLARSASTQATSLLPALNEE